jgi:two-component system, NarL family, nitrate/nitrite response regulator NarL
MHVGTAVTYDRVQGAELEERAPMIRVLVVSENRLHGEGLTLRLSAEPGIRAIGPRETIDATLPLVAANEVDMVLVDVEPTAAHLRELATAARTVDDVPYVALASAESEWEIVDWAEAGAFSIVDRRGSPAELASILLAVHRRESICSPRIAGTLLRCLRSLLREGRPPEGRSRLTHRERDVLSLVGDGMSNKEIAQHLGLQLPTVKNHIHSIFEKLEVSSRAMAVSLALSVGELHRSAGGPAGR